jgi:hypothetical protein
MSEDELKQRFPDYNKSAYGLTASQNPSDVLKPIPYKDKGLSIQIPDSLKSIDSRPYEQKRLEDLLDTTNIFVYLMRERMLEDMSNGSKISVDQKIIFYNDLFLGSIQDIKTAYAYYLTKVGTPGYSVDPNLTSKIDRYYLGSNGSKSLFAQMSDLYNQIIAAEKSGGAVGLSSAQITQFQNGLKALKIDTPKYLLAGDSEDELKEDSFTILQSFADDVSSFFNTLNNSLVPYYIYMFDLAISGVTIPNDEQGAELTRSFVPDMSSLQTLYSDITLAYVFKSDLFAKIINNPRNTSSATQSKIDRYRNNILLLPNVSKENAIVVNKLFDEKKITEVQCESFEEVIKRVVLLNKYFGSLYNIYLASPEKPDYNVLKSVLTGVSSFNPISPEVGAIIKVADKNEYDPEQPQYGFDYMTGNVKYPLVTIIYGFSSDANEAKPLDKASVRAATSSGSVPSAAEVANIISQGAQDAANVVAKGTVDAANTVAKGSTDVANTIAEGSKDAVNKIGSAVSKAFKKPKKPKWL